MTTKERPILFSAPMVRAILNSTKTQTRRAWSVQPPPGVRVGWIPGETSAGRYGRPGERLYVRETWAAPHAYDHLPPRLIPQDARIHYAATEDRGGLLWRPSIHMPRWASRITLEITDVRVERLGIISHEDAIAEGVSSVDEYRMLWTTINGTWSPEIWVWVVDFRRALN